MLRLDDRWLWDFWTVADGRRHHVFYLQAPRALGDPKLRHDHATIGHAVSADLREWTVLADALGPGSPGSWDDRAVWTGSVLRADRGWAMLYTGIGHEQRNVQRIGLATSDDLVNWRRHPANPVLEADGRWYERLGAGAWPEEAWRDPWLMRDAATGRYHALITARAATGGPADGAGVVAAAHSDDLVRWTVGPPITDPGWYGHLEVPQVSRIGGRWYLTFSVEAERHASAHPDHIAGHAVRGVRYRVADGPLGPFLAETDRLLAGDAAGSRYAGKIVQSAGRHYLLSFRCFDPDAGFRGELDDPVPLVELDGRLIVDGTGVE
ncbi:MAG: glycosyl hydrolase family 32 [Solirubrobacteraceae bacterium]